MSSLSLEASETSTSSGDDSHAAASTPWTRLQSAFSYAFARVEPGEDAVPVPTELQEWSINTSLAVLAGIMVFGGRQILRNRQHQVVLQEVTRGAPTKLHAARAVAEENTQRLLKTCREAIRGATICGLAVGGFCGVGQLSAVAHGEHNPTIDLATAGLLTGAVFGGFAPQVPSRLASAALGGAFGGMAGYPIGFIESKMRALLPEEDPRSYKPQSAKASDSDSQEAQGKHDRPVHYPSLSSDSLQSVIQQMEGGLQRPGSKERT